MFAQGVEKRCAWILRQPMNLTIDLKLDAYWRRRLFRLGRQPDARETAKQECSCCAP